MYHKVPWDIIKITTIPPSTVLSGKKAYIPGLLLLPPWSVTTILTMGHPFNLALVSDASPVGLGEEKRQFGQNDPIQRYIVCFYF
jgi:hypothetical protein